MAPLAKIEDLDVHFGQISPTPRYSDPDKMCFLPRPQYLLAPSLPSSAFGRWEVAGREGEKEEVWVGGSEREHGLDVIFYSTAVPGAPGTGSTVQLAPKLTFFRRTCSLLGTLRQGIPVGLRE